MTFGQKLRKIRREKGFSSQESLGMALNLSNNAIARFEVDHYQPRLRTLAKMCKVFDMTYNELLEGVDIE